ncbi:MAG TPA: hypothetical protein DCP38_16440, partial [Acidobacteria bacterium]|nr:hypothetical protein [Acidobacteriota bacterium]
MRGRRGAIAASRPTTSRTRWHSPRRSSTRPSSRCRPSIVSSRGAVCWARPRAWGSSSGSCGSRPSDRARSSRCRSNGSSRARSSFARPLAHRVRSTCAASRIGSICSPTGRCASSTTNSVGRRGPIGRCSCRSTPSARRRRSRATAIGRGGRENRAISPLARRGRSCRSSGPASIRRRFWPTARRASSRPWTVSSAASCRHGRPRKGSAPRVATRPSAGKGRCVTTDARDLGRALSKARRLAVDPSRNIVLEASAGTGKTTVLVERYLNLLRVGVDPANILAMTFTRKAAVEMRERILGALRRAAGQSEEARRLWRALRDRLGDVAITTIDAFCLSLLREFPLEADLDPGFGVADETEAPRLMAQALDRAERTIGVLAARDENVRLLLTLVSASNLRRGLERLLQRRQVATDALRRFLRRGPTDLTPARATARALDRVGDLFQGVAGGPAEFVADGPTGHPRFRMLAADLSRLTTLELDGTDAAWVRSLLDRIGEHLLTQAGTPRQRLPFAAADYPSVAARRRHLGVVRQLGPGFVDLMTRFRRDIGVILARGVRRAHRVAEREYQRTLRAHAVVDFAEIQARALGLLRQMDEFAQSRYRLESRYHHVLVDEFQDTSRAQWELVSLLVQSWGEGLGVLQDAPIPPSIFVVGDRKQSIYRFRDADVALFGEAGDYIARLRPDVPVREAISRSFRAVPALLRFVNDLCGSIDKRAERSDAFRYDGSDRFPLPAESGEESSDPALDPTAPLGLALGEDEAACAAAIASEIDRLMTGATVRDPAGGVSRAIRPDDVAILFRSRISHREYERALAARGLPTYVYKGLGFFDADEVQDLRALIRFLADPASNFWAAALLRSGLVRLSDPAVRALAPELAGAIAGADP